MSTQFTETVRNAYYTGVVDYLMSNADFRDIQFEDQTHVFDVGTSILLARDYAKHYTGGGFVGAFIDNDLREAFSRADLDVMLAMRFLVLLYSNCRVAV